MTQAIAKPTTTAVATQARRSPLNGLATRFNIEPTKLLEILKVTVFKGTKDRPATDEEVGALCIIASKYGLNPFLKELYAFPDGRGGIVPMVPIDGWTRIINTHGDFNGCEFEEVNDDNGKPVSCTCRMFKKGMEHPVAVTEYYTECHRNTEPWNKMPHRMLRHKAFMQAGRYAFSLSGIYDEDEARDIINVTPPRAPVPMPQALAESGPEPTSSPVTGSENTNTAAATETAKGEAVAQPAPASSASANADHQTFEGVIIGVNKGAGKAPYSIVTEFGDRQTGPKFQTFDAGLAANAEGFSAGGETVVITYDAVTKEATNGKSYTNNMIVSITKP